MYKKIVNYIVLFVIFNLTQAMAQSDNDWENPTIYTRNTEPPRATFHTFPSEELALKDQAKSSPNYYLLSG